MTAHLESLLDVSPSTLESASEDFGHIVHRRPVAVARPRSADDVAAIVRAARARRVPLAARGRSHGVFGQSQVEGGWVVDLGALDAVHLDGETARVGAGASWGDVVRATAPAALAPPVLNDFVGLSVGGTLAMGGFGGGSHRHGAQVDNVLELTVVTGAGDVIRCAADREPALFDAVRAGLGQVAIVVEARLRLVPAPPRVRHHLLAYDDAAELFSDLALLVREDRFAELSMGGTIDRDARWTLRIDAVDDRAGHPAAQDEPLSGLHAARVATTEWSRVTYAHRLDAQLAELRACSLWGAPHPWIDVLLPEAEGPAFMRGVLSALRPEDVGETGMVLVYPVRRGAARAPLLPCPEGDVHYVFDVLRATPGATGAALDALLADNRAIGERALAVGGALYPTSAVRMSSADWARHFGAGWDALRSAKHRYDPDGVLGRGWSIAFEPG